ncbi:MAG TPA: cation:proton antiporter [Xanthobacteraceae bacterium]|nr:cation:proton antiporter [Xanthobacteraceae bacterium]
MLSALMLLATALPAFAAEGQSKSAPSDAIFVVEIILLLVVGRLLGEGLQRLGQPEVMGQLVAGLLLGPSLFGAVAPEWQHFVFPKTPEQKAMIDAVSQLGILMLLLLTGMETDLKLVKRGGRASVMASLAGIAVPFVIGYITGEYLPDSLLPDPSKRMVTSLFLGTALSISSIKIVAMVVREMDFLRRTLGQVIVSSAIIDDTLGWIIISVIFSLGLHGSVDTATVIRGIAGTLIFMAVSLTIGRRIVFRLIKWANDTFVSEFPVITMILVIMGAMALITDLIGVHTVLGAFVAGILIGESPILTKHIEEELRGLIVALFMPVFFGLAGLSADLTVLKDPTLLGLTALLIVIASVGKFTGAFIGAELGGLTRREGLALALGMNARGSTEVIVATIGLSISALNQTLFTMIVTMAVLTTLAMPPTLRWALRRLPMSKAEKERLDREEYEETGFVSNLERLLLAADTSTNGLLASRVAGLIAGSRGMPTSVIEINGKIPAKPKPGKEAEDKKGEDKKSDTKKAETKNADAKKAETKKSAKTDDDKDLLAEAVRTAAAAAPARKLRTKDDDDPAAKAEVVTVKPEGTVIETVAAEVKKGYDLLIIGVEKTTVRKNEFHDTVDSLANEFEGPLAIVSSRGALEAAPVKTKLSILLPVTGTETSRNASEIAYTIARATKAPVQILYVASRKNNTTKNRRRRVNLRQNEQTIVKSVVSLADKFGVKVKTSAIADISADESIVEIAKEEGHNLIILGVTRRDSDRLFFGNTAAGVLEKAETSLVFVSN